MKKIILLFFLCVLTCLVMTASSLTPQQARNSAEMFVKNKASMLKSAKFISVKQVKPYFKSAESKTKVFAVNFANDNGFVLVGGNEYGDEIIGYCDHGTFDEASIPANMRAWLDSYLATADRVSDAKQARSIRATTGKTPTKTPIAPLLKSKWSQTSPYNNECPIVDGKNCPTGCTITAMAQIMYYHRWPAGPTLAIPAYTPVNSGGTNYPSLPALEPTTFDWDKIYPTYTNNEDGSEVARLNKYLGFASHAHYSTKETSATGFNALQAMKQYFGYNPGAHAVWRQQLSYSQWVNKLYAELQAKRPVMFSGATHDNAHSYIVDGYDEEDYFHVNWGWGGTSDGYYRVMLMDPKDQGTGGSADNDAYTMDQVAFFDVQPNTGQQAHDPRLTVRTNWLFTDPQDSGDYNVTSNESTSPFIKDKGYLVYPGMNCTNFNAVGGEFNLGCRLVKNDGSVTKDFEWFTLNFGVKDSYSNNSKILYLNPEIDTYLTSGDYKLFFIGKLKNATEWQLDEGSEDHYININIDNTKGLLTATSVSREPKLAVKEVTVKTATPMVNKPVDVTIKIQNNGTAAYHGNLGLAVPIQNDMRDWLDAIESDIEPGETINLALSFTPKAPGTITYTVDDKDSNALYNGTINVAESNITSDIPLTITHQVTNAYGQYIPAPRALIDVTVTNDNDKTYQGEIAIYCFKWTGDKYKFVYTSRIETIPAHQTVVLHRESPELTDADSYSFTTMYMKGDKQEEQDADGKYYYTLSYYTTYNAGGKATTHLINETVQPDSTVCTVDLTTAPSITSVNTAANPNTIVIVPENSTITGDNIVKGTKAQNVKLTDGFPFYCPITFTAEHISYTRTPERHYDVSNNKGWTTMTLPFAATSCHATINGAETPLRWHTSNSSDGDIFVANFKYENGSEMEFSLPETSTLNPCQPYLLGVPATVSSGMQLMNIPPITFSAHNVEVFSSKSVVTGRDYKLVGTMAAIKDKEGIYTLNADGSEFVLGGAQSVYPFHAYFAPIAPTSLAAKLAIIFNHDQHTGIDTILDHQPIALQGPIYNLNGQRVTRPGKGIYIVGGKKVIFK